VLAVRFDTLKTDLIGDRIDSAQQLSINISQRFATSPHSAREVFAISPVTTKVAASTGCLWQLKVKKRCAERTTHHVFVAGLL